MIEQVHSHRRFLICIVLALATFAVYLPVRNHEFVGYDDDVYVTENPNILSGLSWQSVKWAFTTAHGTNWHPLTSLSHQLDCQLFGLNSRAHHLVNVLFHVANTLLLFIVLSRMTKGFWQSVFVAGLFALHPLHVESVAWVAERKDMLSTMFWLLTMLAYAKYAERPSTGRYIVALVLFVLGLLSKPMLVTLPLVLLLLDYWPLNRFQNSKFSILTSIIEKVPFFALSAISSVITFLVQQKGGAMTLIPLKERVTNAICSYLAYLGKMFWPVNLAVLYPHPAGFLPVSRAVIYGIILILITALVVYYGRRYKYLVTGWLWYLGTLVPVIGIVQVGAQAMADRYTYVPLTGIFIIIAFGAADLLKNIRFKRFILTAFAVPVLFGCVLITSAQLKHWKNSYLLFEHALKVMERGRNALNSYTDIPNSPQIHNNFANALRQKGRADEAIEHYKIALELDRSFSIARRNLGLTLAEKGRYDEAIKQFSIYYGTDVNITGMREEFGSILARQGKVEDAVGQYQKALAEKPDSVSVLSHLGYTLAQSGKPGEAVEYYSMALRIDPNDIMTHGRLALALSSLGRIDEAIEHCRIVLKSLPNDAEMHNNLGILLQTKGDFKQAAECYRKALQINPDFTEAQKRLDSIAGK
jgi:tetratricopeptide (TPR) repeat protein